MHEPDEETTYRLGPAKAGLWLAFTPSGHDVNRTWQMQVTARGRGGAKVLASLMQTTALRPLATVTVKGQSYPLTIGWHERKRGGGVSFGGERKLGQDDGELAWEMRCTPDDAGCCLVEMRLQTTPRRSGDLQILLHVPLHQPDVWSLGAAAARGHCAQTVFSAYSRYAVQFVALEEEAGWDEPNSGFEIVCRRFPFGGGKMLRFSLGFLPMASAEEARATLTMQYAALADAQLHPLKELPDWQTSDTAAMLSDPANYAIRGAERLYLRLPVTTPEAEDVFQAGFPHYPLDALRALWDWNRFHPADHTPRLVRYGATGIAADFQVMGRGDQAEPNKGAFWDRKTDTTGTDFAEGQTHGIAANARIARGLFGLHAALGEPLLRQSALNICQWLILKMNDVGYYNGERVWATRGLADDGKPQSQPCSLDGAEAIRPFVMAFRATKNEVFIKAAWKIANHLLETRMREFEGAPPPAVAAVILACLALDAEAPNARLRASLPGWGAWLRAMPLTAETHALNADGLHDGLYDCALAGFALHALLRDTAYLRYAWAALEQVPTESRALSWRTLGIQTPALLSLASLLPDARPDFDALTVARDWRIYAPDPATDEYIRVHAPDGSPIQTLPLVSRQDDQMLLLVLAPHTTECVSIFKNGRRPLVRDLLTGTLDTDACLHPLGTETWAHAGLFTIEP
jgi:hypothetical protein